ncbi:MAG: hypothetical protein HQM08_27275 [Candidatus Riflebacteria bacterium]|nr:hypothetical protein [Candidatus Riflebacteria bacterium]
MNTETRKAVALSVTDAIQNELQRFRAEQDLALKRFENIVLESARGLENAVEGGHSVNIIFTNYSK